jgi:hypothetical protein
MPPTKKREAEEDAAVDLTAEEGTPTNDADSNVAKKSSMKPTTKKPAKKPKVELPDIIPQSDAPRAEPPGTAPPGAKRFKCVCWNVAGLRALLDKNPQTLRRIADVEAPDVICLQEHKLQDVHVSSVVERLKTMLPGVPHGRVRGVHGQEGIQRSRHPRQGANRFIQVEASGNPPRIRQESAGRPDAVRRPIPAT